MEKEFVDFNLALRMEQLGFKEKCLATIDQVNYLHINGTKSSPRGSMMYDIVPTPTWQSAFRWFLKTHHLYGVVIPTITMDWTFKTTTVVDGLVEVPPYNHVDAYDYPTHYEAQQACLEKLIEIVEKQNK